VPFYPGYPFPVIKLVCHWLQLLPPSNLRRTALQALLKRIHDAKAQKMCGRNLFTSVIELSTLSGAGGKISTPIRNMLW